VCSHGWFDLPPFAWDEAGRTLRRVILTSPRRARALSIREARPGTLSIAVEAPGKTPSPAGERDRSEAVRQVRHMLRLDEPFGEFHDLCRGIDGYAWVDRAKSGPLLRAPDPYEDLVKMICTTNCTWALTRVMVRGLVRELGVPAPGDPAARSFPTAEAMAERPLRFYTQVVKAGYRGAYLRDLARRVASGDLDPRRWLDPGMPVEEIREEIRSVRGAGRYVADNVLKLLGRYEGLGIDSWCRRKFSEMHGRGRAVSDRMIERFYAPFGAWRGLALWCDLTREWFDGDLPFSLRKIGQEY
jgi:N-glycosylase/DNA lyase